MRVHLRCGVRANRVQREVQSPEGAASLARASVEESARKKLKKPPLGSGSAPAGIRPVADSTVQTDEGEKDYSRPAAALDPSTLPVPPDRT